MLRWYIDLKPLLPHIDHDALQELLLGLDGDERLQSFLKQLSDMDSITLKLQSYSTTICCVHIPFDDMLNKSGKIRQYLHTRANMVEIPIFKEPHVKVLRGEEKTLKKTEQRALHHLPNEPQTKLASSLTKISFSSFSQENIKKSRTTDVATESFYIKSCFIFSTSNFCRRLFSIACDALSDRRKRLWPTNPDMQLFLHIKHQSRCLRSIRIIYWLSLQPIWLKKIAAKKNLIIYFSMYAQKYLFFW